MIFNDLICFKGSSSSRDTNSIIYIFNKFIIKIYYLNNNYCKYYLKKKKINIKINYYNLYKNEFKIQLFSK